MEDAADVEAGDLGVGAAGEAGPGLEVFEIRMCDIVPYHARAGGEAVEFGVVVEGEIKLAVIDREFVVGGFGLVWKACRADSDSALFEDDGYLFFERQFWGVHNPEPCGVDAEEQ